MIVTLMMLLPYAIALVLFAAEACGWLDGRAKPVPKLRVEVWVAALVATYAVQLAVTLYAATHGARYAPWRLQMPLPVMDLGVDHVDAVEAAMLACGALQSYALVALYRSKPSLALVAGGAIVMLAISFAAPALSSGDLYSNVGYSLVANAYATPALPFGGQYAAIDHWWGTPLVPSPYGPLWNLLDRVTVVAIPTLLGKMLALRVLCAFAFGGLIATMHRFGLPARMLIVTALNPAFYMQFVANAHNDIVILLVVAVAALCVRRNLALATAALVVAGLLKLPYALLALPVLAAVRDRRLRFAMAALVLGATLGLSWWWGGRPYAQALVEHAKGAHGFFGWHLVATLIAIALLVAALAGARRLRTGVWLIPSLGSLYPAFLFPWYLMWSFPYALGRRRVLGYLLIWFPFASVLVNQHIMQVWTLIVVFPLIVVFALMPAPRAPAVPLSSRA